MSGDVTDVRTGRWWCHHFGLRELAPAFVLPGEPMTLERFCELLELHGATAEQMRLPLTSLEARRSHAERVAEAARRPLPWANPWRPFGRCRARLDPADAGGGMWGRCDLEANHSRYVDHALERGMVIVRWSTAVRWDGPES